MTQPKSDTVSRMALWLAVNEALRERGQPEVLFAEARYLFGLAQEYDRREAWKHARRELEERATA